MTSSKWRWVGALLALIGGFGISGLAAAHPGHGVINAGHPLHHALEPLHLTLWFVVAVGAVWGFYLFRRYLTVVRTTRRVVK